MTNHHIDEAYCVEMNRNVTIFEANDYYFSPLNSEQKRLNFECPDEECRKIFHPKITGVNYDKEIFIKAMHFRINKNYKHSETCWLGLYENTLREMLRHKDSYRRNFDRNLFLDIPESETFPDIFQPRREVEKLRMNKNESSCKHEKISSLSKQSIEDRICRAKHKTRSLKIVVDAFERLEINQRNIPTLSIEGQKMKYGTAFKHIRYIEEWQTWPHIYYGSARIYRNRDGFRAYFKDRVKRYLPEKPGLEASIFFPLKQGDPLTEHPYDALDIAAKTKEYCCIYMFASKTLVNAPLGSSEEPKEWIKLDSAPGETVITFNKRLCI